MKQLRGGKELTAVLTVSLVVVLASSGCLGEYVKFGDPQVQEGGAIISFAVGEGVLGASHGKVPYEIWINGLQFKLRGLPYGSNWASGFIGDESIQYWGLRSETLSLKPDVVNVEFSNTITTSYRIRVANTSLTYPITVELRDGDKVLDKFTVNYGPNVDPYSQCPAEGKITSVVVRRYPAYELQGDEKVYSHVFAVNVTGRGFQTLEAYVNDSLWNINRAGGPDDPCALATVPYSIQYSSRHPFNITLKLKTNTGKYIDSTTVGTVDDVEILHQFV
ncbi:Uncharacterised protein [uncultured archaeon]|nr:Uncharacterised protein [uncultured archaeon]